MPSIFATHKLNKELVECIEEIIRLGSTNSFVGGKLSSIPNKFPNAYEQNLERITQVIASFGFSLNDEGSNRYRLVDGSK